jgi:hypothetical protein
MKTNKYTNIKITFLAMLIFTLASCERELSDDKMQATFSTTAEIFTDTFIGMGSDFYFPFVGDGAKPDVFSIDADVAFESAAAIKIDVPDATDPAGGFAGFSFVVDGAGRDLSNYDALTFWAKSSQSANIGAIGFGETPYTVLASNIAFTTRWTKFIIPIPDASQLIEERGMFIISAGGIGSIPGQEVGYTFWLDEMKFEKLGTVAQPRSSIFNGEDKTETSFTGSKIAVSEISQTFNLGSGAESTVVPSPNYFVFATTDTSVATVTRSGEISILGESPKDPITGEYIPTIITASLGGLEAAGSLAIVSLGDFTPAPVPTVNPSNVISIFSDAYANQPVEYYNGYWAPYQTTLGQNDVTVNGDSIIKYSVLNFVGTQFTQPTINVSSMTHFHVDIQVINELNPGDFLTLRLQDIGPDNTFGTGDDTSGEIKYTGPTLIAGTWVSLDIPLSSFPGLSGRSNMAQVVFVSDATVTDVYVDNMYFHN